MTQERRLSNEQIVSRLKNLEADILKERQHRSDPSKVLNRENSFQLDGLIGRMHQMTFQFEAFTSKPRIG